MTFSCYIYASIDSQFVASNLEILELKYYYVEPSINSAFDNTSIPVMDLEGVPVQGQFIHVNEIISIFKSRIYNVHVF
jgi:hypothetical protein